MDTYFILQYKTDTKMYYLNKNIHFTTKYFLIYTLIVLNEI